MLFLGLYNTGFSQPKGVPEYFNYPLSLKPRLNANFGEMRPNHFHMGLDLSTDSKENLPVYAPADGFVSRIKIESGGFGRAIYLDHPNGTTTLYAHMNNFMPAIEKYLEDKQYEQESWKIDIKIPAGVLPVVKGQQIGYSGNTGASQGPHVHFEIRDTKTDDCLNPLRFRFLLPDVTPPDLFKVAFYDRDKSIYEQRPVVYPLIKKSDAYQIAGRVELPFEKVFMAIQATDRMTGVPNTNGIFAAQVRFDNQWVSSFTMDTISYEMTRYLNGHIDYPSKYKGGPYYQLLFPANNMNFPIYKTRGKNFISITDVEQECEIEVSDAYFNKSVLRFSVVRKQGSVEAEKQAGQMMRAGEMNIYEDDQIQFVFDEHAFYDDFHFSVQSSYTNAAHDASLLFQTSPVFIPVHTNFKIRIKPVKDLDLLNTDRLVVKRSFGGKTEIKKAKSEKDGFSATFRELGNFQLIHDIQPPQIFSHLQQGARLNTGSKIHFDVVDDLEVIKEFKVQVDGSWLMFKPQGKRYSYTVDEHFPKGEHKLTVLVVDEAGNAASKDFLVTRN